MVQGINKRIIQLIYDMDFYNAKILFDELDNAEKSDLIIMEACTSNNIMIIGFVYFLLSKEKSCFNHELAAKVLIQMCWIDGAYNLAYLHACEMLKLEPSIKNKEFILFFYNIPEKIISYEYAKELAEDIIRHDPDNEVALSVID